MMELATGGYILFVYDEACIRRVQFFCSFMMKHASGEYSFFYDGSLHQENTVFLFIYDEACIR